MPSNVIITCCYYRIPVDVMFTFHASSSHCIMRHEKKSFTKSTFALAFAPIWPERTTIIFTACYALHTRAKLFTFTQPPAEN